MYHKQPHERSRWKYCKYACCRRQKETEAGNVSGTGQLEDSFQQHPDFPYLPASVPLTYTLTMKACLSERPDDRPSFAHLTVLLEDLLHEVAHGSYINSLGKMEVRISTSYCVMSQMKYMNEYVFHTISATTSANVSGKCCR